MKAKKLVIEGAVTFAVAGTLAITAVTGTDKAAESSVRTAETESYGFATAGAASVMNAFALDSAKMNDDPLTIEQENKFVVAASGIAAQQVEELATEAAQSAVVVTETAEEAEATENTADAQEANAESAKIDGLTAGAAAATLSAEAQLVPTEETLEEQKEWENALMADVEDFVYVRAKKNAGASIVGRLIPGDRATVLRQGSKWTKIKSGNLTGYVLNKYCVFGEEAYAYAKENCDTIATVTVKALRIRDAQSTDSKVVTTVAKDTDLIVNDEKETGEGWVAVTYEGDSGYVSEGYVTLSLGTTTAKTLAEEQEAEEARKKAEEQKAAAEAAAKASANAQSTAPKTEQKAAVSADVDEETLLAAIIQCEAGGCSYECQKAVGAVVLNRVRSKKYPNNIKDVIYQKGQFGPVRNGSLKKRLSGTISKTAKKAARAALAGEDNTGGALYFNDVYATSRGTKIGPIRFW